MKMISKTALSLVIAGASVGANAELKYLDDSAMSELTGRAGLTIDLETKYTIGEFMYKDAGSVFLAGISFGANENVDPGGYFDNVRATIDIAGAGDGNKLNAGVSGDDDYLETGFSSVRKVAGIQSAVAAGTSGASSTDEAKFVLAELGQVTVSDAIASGIIASNATTTGPMTIESKKTYGNGDLLIHVSYKDAWEKLGGLSQLLATGDIAEVSFSELIGDGLTKAKDFNFSIDAIGIASSAFEAGDSIGQTLSGYQNAAVTGADLDADDTTTTLISGLSVNGYLGPVDIHIENDGNGFQYNLGNGTIIEGAGNADSVINWDTYVNITDLDVYLDNWDGLSGVRIEDMKINNVRGDVTDIDGNFSFGFAHTKREIYAVKDTAGLSIDGTNVMDYVNTSNLGTLDLNKVFSLLNEQGVDGIALNTHFKGDKEIGALSFGDSGRSIGQLYWTDIESEVNWIISAH